MTDGIELKGETLNISGTNAIQIKAVQARKLFDTEYFII